MEDKIVLYSSSSCGMCKMIKLMLENSKLKFEINQDVQYMLQNGISNIPVLEVNGSRMNAFEARNWINGKVKNH